MAPATSAFPYTAMCILSSAHSSSLAEAKRALDDVVHAKGVQFKEPVTSDALDLLVAEPDACDTAWEMKQAILERAYPTLFKGLQEVEEAGAELAARLVARDIEVQSRKLLRVGVTFGNGAELLRSRQFAFWLKRPNSFEFISVAKANGFCAGSHRLAPSSEGLVFLAFIEVAFRERDPVSAAVSIALKLRANPDGSIIVPHRADAFGGDNEDDHDPVRERRNEVVAWTLTSKMRKALELAVAKKLGEKVSFKP